MKAKTILLVEDDFLNRRFTKKALLENGYDVLESKNAIEAIATLKKLPVDLIIIDINLGEQQQNGIDLAQEIKRHFSIPFIYLTAYDTTEISKKAVETIPHAYITKPFKNVDLVTSIELAIRQTGDREKHKPTIRVKDGEYYIDLPIDEIDYIESDGNYLLYHAGVKVYKARAIIRQMLEYLPTDTFIQTHRAYIVNKRKIEKSNSKNVVVNSKEIPVSKTYLNAIMT